MVKTANNPQYSRLRKLGQYLRPHWQTVLLGILALFIVNGLGTYLPLLIRNAIDDLEVAFSFGPILRNILFIGGLASLMWCIRMASRIWLFGVGRQVEFDLKQKIFEHLLSLEPAYFQVNTAGDLINRATSDVDNIRRLVGFAVLSLANTLFAYALRLPVMLAIDPVLSLTAIAVYPLIMLLVQVFSHRLRNEQLAVQQALSDLSELVQEDMSGVSLIKIYAQETNEQQEFQQLNQALLVANLKLAKTRNILFPVLGGMASISLLVLLALGSRAIPTGNISVGDFIALLLYVEQLIFPTALLGFTITAYQRGEVSIDRVEAILGAQPQIQSPETATALDKHQVQGQLTAKNLTYTYPGAATPALNQVNFQIQPGETVAIVGPVGSGKSTLVNALPRLLDIAPGQLFVDGQDITQVHLWDLRAAIAYVPQDSFLFSTSLKNNIRYGNPLSDASEVEYVAKQAQIHDEVLNFPQRYQTLVGERGITLSGGQRQRTALSRALLVDAPILILDDALSSVDNQTATEILNHLSEETQRKTVVFISHHLSAAAIADQIFVMDQGAIVQRGTHEDLVHQPGLYQTLWNQQKLEEQLV
ncbi:MAG: ABC transporter ATP-binding protein [Acaryochloris sp. RU_4_1]|nr:ABC transporter ATP-binding protein [Acaryochloris sp. RU_4_1]NJN38336.1 ABC transporter ATP-binding protein [Acaryochloridaceae cyanobacterium CSU_3_4]NJR53587.1 ABC transporter ATP-binding protein [Acaryochloris sp. CRU_2_0]